MRLALILLFSLLSTMSFSKVETVKQSIAVEIEKEIKNIDFKIIKDLVHDNGNRLVTVEYIIPEDLNFLTKAAIAEKLETIGYNFLVCSTGEVLPLLGKDNRINSCK